MCRWMAWFGEPVLMEELLFKTQHGLVDQSLHSRMGAETTNGDGIGVGWYGGGDGPAVYRSVAPAWGDENLRELAAHVASPLFMSHVRAAIGSPVQQTNCHPFRHGNWLFVHNGFVDGFTAMRRELMLTLDADLFASVQGSTDTEVIFHMALSEGLGRDPIGALERVVGRIEDVAAAHGIADAMQGSFGISDGDHLWAVRYSTAGKSRSLFASNDIEALKRLHPDNERLRRVSAGDRVIVSEPFSDLSGAWTEIPEATAVTVHRGGAMEMADFRPAHMPAAVA
jgi:predicted glutamine amidotransferase